IPILRQYFRRATRIAQSKAIPTATEIPILRQYFRRATRIVQSKAIPTATGEPASLLRDDSHGEAFPTYATITLRIEGSLYPPAKAATEMALQISAQNLEISNLKARIKLLEDKDKRTAEPTGDDTQIKGRSLETGKEADVSVPPAVEVSNVGVPTGSGLVPTVSAIFTTASVVTPYSRRKEEEMAREDQRLNEQIARDAEIARIHAEEEMQMLIDGLDRNNEVIAKHL
nr:hypothetical protein [Tanacetum cinerariifolium]